MNSQEPGDEVGLYFLTDVIVGWQHVFTSPDLFDIIIESLNRCREEKDFRLHAYVIMPSHAHTIISARSENLPDIIRGHRRFTSLRIIERLELQANRRLLRYFLIAGRSAAGRNEFKVWQTGNGAIGITRDEFFQQKLSFVHDAPVRKGYVELPEQWRYSSARNYYCDDHSVIAVDTLG